MTTPISDTADETSARAQRRRGPALLYRALPMVAAVAVAAGLAAAYAQREWADTSQTSPTNGPWGLTWSQVVLALSIVVGVVSSLILGYLTLTARGGRTVSIAAVGVPLATGFAAAGVPSALLGLVGVAVALRWLGVDI